MFLVQYLCNGFNLVEAGELTYSQYYFDIGRKAFKFKRVKTTNCTEGGSEVIIPIIKPLQRILDEIAAEPTLNGFVFPDILQGATLKADKRKNSITDRYIAQYPLETQFEYNSKLLDLEPKMEDINNMTEEQKTAMLLKLLV